jgi:hypothetical protein
MASARRLLRTYPPALIACCVIGSQSALGARNECNEAVFAVTLKIGFELRRIEIDGVREGEFKIENEGPMPVVFAVWKQADRTRLDYPNARLQFRRGEGRWEDILYPAGTYFGGRDRLTISSGKTAVVVITLEPDAKVRKDADQYRVVTKPLSMANCVASEPFAIPE